MPPMPPMPSMPPIPRPIDPDIFAGFLAEVRGYLPRIGSGLAAAGRPGSGAEALAEAHRLMHTIKGASAMVGLAPVSHIAGYAERELDRALGTAQERRRSGEPAVDG